jgi:hypothetical protein
VSIPVLDSRQTADFRRDGFVLFESIFTDAELTALQDEAERVLSVVVGSTLTFRQRNPRLDLHVLTPTEGILRKIQPINDLSALFEQLSQDRRLLGPLTELLSDIPVLMEEKLNYKQRVSFPEADLSFLADRPEEAAEGAFVVHHDWGYYRVNGYPDSTLSSAIALDDCEGRGPIRVIPGSHLLDPPLADPTSPSGRIQDGQFGEDQLIPVNMSAGSLMIFHSKLVHDSEPNRTDLPRRMMIYSHFPASHDTFGDHDRRNGRTRQLAQDIEERYRASLSS